eukprot:Nitzschia sp. Nitz4//scaffold124_size66437//44338//45732//NITZ4_006115-RA/size66437-processed-gene-0.42-mRNA-1//1//CDS//3329534564//7138//frame0
MKQLKQLFRSRNQQQHGGSSNKNKGCHESSSTKEMPAVLPPLPGVIWAEHVMPYLDRVSQNRLSITCKDIYLNTLQCGMHGTSWPHGKFSFARPVDMAVMSADMTTLAVVLTGSKSITLWDRKKGFSQKLKGHAGPVSHVSFSSKGVLASCSRTDQTIRLWSQRGESSLYVCVQTIATGVTGIRYVKFSPCGSVLAHWGSDRAMRLDQVRDHDDSTEQEAVSSTTMLGTTVWRTRPGIHCCDTVAFPMADNLDDTPSTVLVHAFNNEVVKVWNWEEGTSVTLHDNSSDGSGGVSTQHPITMVKMLTTTDESTGKVNQFVVVGYQSALIKIWDWKNLRCIRSFRLGGEWRGLTQLEFSPDGSKVACSGKPGTDIGVYDMTCQRPTRVLQGHKNDVTSVTFAPNNSLMISCGGKDRTLRLWDLDNESNELQLSKQPPKMEGYAFDKNSTTHAWATTSSPILATGKS